MKTILTVLAASLAFTGLAWGDNVTGQPLDSKYYSAEFWIGEYPGPVLKLTQSVTFDAVAELPTTNVVTGKAVKCTVKKGVYHPWAKKTKAKYFSVSGISVFQANKDTEINLGTENKIPVKAGETVELLSYLSEGYCLMRANGITGDESCGILSEEGSAFTEVTHNEYYQQWLGVKCKEGRNAFIEVSDKLFTIKGVVQGEITDYGSVKE